MKMDLFEIDPSGAIGEAHENVEGDTRLDFMKKAGLGAGAVITLEYLEAAFYNQAMANNLALDPMTAIFLKTVTRDENKHVKFLKGALGGKAAKEPKFGFGDTVTHPAKFMATAQVLENTGVTAYLGQAANIKSKKNLTAAGSILTIEARHARSSASSTR